jgi:hypothetical protein
MRKNWTILLGMIILSSCLISLVSGEESIDLTYPNEVIVGEVFEVNLTLIDFAEDVYDVKIDIYDEIDDSQRLSEIWAGDSWQSTYSYVNEAINTSESNSFLFRLNITEDYEGTANITIKIRDGDTEIFEDYQIDISPSTQQTPDDNNDDDIYLELEWDDEEIINGDEFEIKVNAYNLLDELYNLKIWIKFDDNDTIISDGYHEDNEEWKSSKYYVDEFFEGDGNNDKMRRIDLRIREAYRDFRGNDVEICFKLEDEPDTEECENIGILEEEIDEVYEPLPVQTTTSNSVETIGVTGNVIQLNQQTTDPKTEDLKEQNNILYQSKTELMKKYAIFIFAFFCVALSALLVFNKLK